MDQAYLKLFLEVSQKILRYEQGKLDLYAFLRYDFQSPA